MNCVIIHAVRLVKDIWLERRDIFTKFGTLSMARHLNGFHYFFLVALTSFMCPHLSTGQFSKENFVQGTLFQGAKGQKIKI